MCPSRLQLGDLMVAPACTDRAGASPARAAHVPAGVADKYGPRRLSARFGHGREGHCRMRLGWIAVSGLQRNETPGELVAFKAVFQAAIALPGRDSQPP